MIGAIIGDIAGSRFEGRNYRAKDFELLADSCDFTDDSIMSLGVAKAILEADGDLDRLPGLAVTWMQTLGRPYPCCGYGGRFYHWMYTDDPQPYNSFGNGAAMRISPCGWAGESLDEVKALAHAVTAVSHNHPEGLKGAEAVATAIFMARTGRTKERIREAMEGYYDLKFTLDAIRPTYRFDVTCQGSVPQAIVAFLEGTGFEDVIRNAVSIGGDSDTIAAMAGSIAEAFFGVPDHLRQRAECFLDGRLLPVLREFEARFPRDRA